MFAASIAASAAISGSVESVAANARQPSARNSNGSTMR
jgi:hypothetical protein